jgi:hypothetical protein
MLRALDEARTARTNGSSVSVYSIARANKVPYTTLRDYIKKGYTTIPKLGRPLILEDSVEQEFVAFLGDRVLAMAPVDKPTALIKLGQIVERRHMLHPDKCKLFGTTNGLPSDAWWRGFLARNPQIRLRTPSRHDFAKLRASFNASLFHSFFKQANDPNTGIVDIPIARRYHADEFSLSLEAANEKVLFLAGSRKCIRHALMVKNGNAHVNLMNCISADGHALRTGVLFGKRSKNIKFDKFGKHVVTMGYTGTCTCSACSS